VHSKTCIHGEVLLQYTVAMMGYGPEEKNAVLELTYNYGVSKYAKGNAYAQVWDVDCLHLDQLNNSWGWNLDINTRHTQIAIGTDDVYKTAEVVKLFGGQVVREPGPLPGISTRITAILDPDGWKSVPGSRLVLMCSSQIICQSERAKAVSSPIAQVFVDNIDFAKELE